MTQISLEVQQQEWTKALDNDVISDVINRFQVSASVVSEIVFNCHFYSQYIFSVVLTKNFLQERNKNRLMTTPKQTAGFLALRPLVLRRSKLTVSGPCKLQLVLDISAIRKTNEINDIFQSLDLTLLKGVE